MGPSVRSAGTRTRKAQPTLLGYAKVSKSTAVTTSKKGVEITIKNVDALSKFVEDQKRKIDAEAKKRKRGIYASEAEESETEETTVKKVKICLPSPPSSDRSRRSTPEVSSAPCLCLGHYDRSSSPPPMPQGLRDFLDMHVYFIKAFSLHRAHNGPSAPAELHELMLSMTRLYKRKSIGKEDIQRMLAIYEVEEKTEIPAKASLVCTKGPFKLITSGVGSNRRNFVEYVSTSVDVFSGLQNWKAKSLHDDYKLSLEMAWLYGRRNKLSFLHGPVAEYPLLAIAVGSQTASRQQKASDLRKHVLGKGTTRAKSPEFSDLSIRDPDSPPQAPKAVKARTLSLFERVKAKQSANAATPAPTSEAVLRRHAIARLDEVVEVLKMKQHQRLNALSGGSDYTEPETPLRRVSFTMTELIKIVKGSLTTPMADAELKTCIDILAREAPGFWLRRLSMDVVLCVVMQGRGPVGKEVQQMLKAKARRELDAEICDVEETD